jgi:hypothetical protein
VQVSISNLIEFHSAVLGTENADLLAGTICYEHISCKDVTFSYCDTDKSNKLANYYNVRQKEDK